MNSSSVKETMKLIKFPPSPHLVLQRTISRKSIELKKMRLYQNRLSKMILEMGKLKSCS